MIKGFGLLVFKLQILVVILTANYSLHAQSAGYAVVNVASNCGYTISVQVSPTFVVPNSTSCSSGYNYEIQFNYAVTVSGVNTCQYSTSTIQIFPTITCLTVNNSSNYAITVNPPVYGAASTTYTQTGTLVTSTNQWNGHSDCLTSTPQSLQCNSLTVAFTNVPGQTGTTTVPITYGSALPVELTFFTGKCSTEGIVFDWQTESESNCANFTIKQSNDGKQWKTLFTIDGAGTTTEVQNYSVRLNERITETTYFRLFQTDYDGKTTLKKTISIEPCSNTDKIFTMYPNPGDGNFTLQTNENNYQLIIHDIGGRQLYTCNDCSTIDLSSLAGGTYYCSMIQQDRIKQTEVFFVQH